MYVSEAYARVMLSRATTRSAEQEAKKAAPVLPAGFGQPMLWP